MTKVLSDLGNRAVSKLMKDGIPRHKARETIMNKGGKYVRVLKGSEETKYLREQYGRSSSAMKAVQTSIDRNKRLKGSAEDVRKDANFLARAFNRKRKKPGLAGKK